MMLEKSGWSKFPDMASPTLGSKGGFERVTCSQKVQKLGGMGSESL